MNEPWRNVGTDSRSPKSSSPEAASGSAPEEGVDSFWNRLDHRRRWFLLSVVIIAVSIAFLGAAAAPDYLLEKAEEKLSARLGGDVTIGSIETGMETVKIRELSWRSAEGDVVARAEELLVRGLDLPAVVAGERPLPEAVEGRGLHITLDVEGKEARNLVERLKNRGTVEADAGREGTEKAGSDRSLRGIRLDLHEVSAEIFDARGSRIVLEDGSLAGAAYTPVAFSAGRLSVVSRVEGTGAGEEAGPPSQLLDVEGVEGEIRLNPVSDDEAGAWRFAGRLEGQRVVTAVRGLAEGPVEAGPWAGQLKGAVVPSREGQPLTIQLEEGLLRHRELETRLAGQLALLPGDEGLGFQVEGAAHLPPTSCQAFAEGIPSSLLGSFSAGLEMQGEIAGSLRWKVDSQRYADLELDFDVDDGCVFQRAPGDLRYEELLAPFELRRTAADGKGEVFFESGPGGETWVPLAQVSPYVVDAVLAHEDPAFFRHAGFAPWAIETSLAENLEAGRFVRGASTISMQLAKNLYLSHDKTLSRKAREALLTWWLEEKLTKLQILELYLNVIEYGPDLYGIGPAARHYFGTEPSELGPEQAAFLATILPSPKRYARRYPGPDPSAFVDGQMRYLLRRMEERGWLQASEHERAVEGMRNLWAVEEERRGFWSRFRPTPPQRVVPGAWQQDGGRQEDWPGVGRREAMVEQSSVVYVRSEGAAPGSAGR